MASWISGTMALEKTGNFEKMIKFLKKEFLRVEPEPIVPISIVSPNIILKKV
jgi:hypothetical protein